MNFIKKRLFLISCLAIVVLGLGAFAWGAWKASGNQKALAALAQQCKSVDSLRNQVIAANVLAQLKNNADLAQQDKEMVLTLAQQTTRRALLYEEVFPQPREENTKLYYIEFGKRYVGFINALLAEVNAGDKPSEKDEEKTRKEYEESTQNASDGSMQDIGALRGGSSQSQVDNLLANFRRERANSIGVYANSDSFCGYEYWSNWNGGDKKEMQESSWYTQLAAWIQEDVILAIKEVNGQSQRVPDSPVKRLIEISFNGNGVKADGAAGMGVARSASYGSQQGVASRRDPASVNILPGYVIKANTGSAQGEEQQNLQGVIIEPWTGHVSNDLIDVVQFEVAVVVDSTRIQDFMSALQSKKFSLDSGGQAQNLRDQITILQLHMAPLNLETEMEGGYYYGSGAITALRLVCEYCFFKSGYQDLMPGPVKEVFEGESGQKMEDSN